MEYAFQFNEHGTFTPSGKQDIADAEAYNKQLEQIEIAQLMTHPDRLFLYVKMPDRTQYEIDNRITPLSGAQITTWLGTVVSEKCSVGTYYSCPGFYGQCSKRRPVNCTIFGVKYYGTYFESSGNYCRLRRAKQN